MGLVDADDGAILYVSKLWRGLFDDAALCVPRSDEIQNIDRSGAAELFDGALRRH